MGFHSREAKGLTCTDIFPLLALFKNTFVCFQSRSLIYPQSMRRLEKCSIKMVSTSDSNQLFINVTISQPLDSGNRQH